MEAQCRVSGHTSASRGGSLASPYAVVRWRISGDYGEVLLLPAKQGKGEFHHPGPRQTSAEDAHGVTAPTQFTCFIDEFNKLE